MALGVSTADDLAENAESSSKPCLGIRRRRRFTDRWVERRGAARSVRSMIDRLATDLEPTGLPPHVSRPLAHGAGTAVCHLCASRALHPLSDAALSGHHAPHRRQSRARGKRPHERIEGRPFRTARTRRPGSSRSVCHDTHRTPHGGRGQARDGDGGPLLSGRGQAGHRQARIWRQGGVERAGARRSPRQVSRRRAPPHPALCGGSGRSRTFPTCGCRRRAGTRSLPHHQAFP